MNPFGSTRSRVCRDHALICPDSFVRSSLPGWTGTEGVILISPQMGARFAQYLALMEPGAIAGPPLPGIERVLYVLDGDILLQLGRDTRQVLTTGGYAYLPPGAPVEVRARSACRLNVFEKRYQPLPRVPPPKPRFGQEHDFEGVPFLGDPDAVLRVLLPVEAAFDLAVNVFTFQPGTTLPLVEVHVMEHGLLMLQGQGVYRLADAWYPVQAGDVIWMASYCPQWFVATGKAPARYLYYKDVHRDPLEANAAWPPSTSTSSD